MNDWPDTEQLLDRFRHWLDETRAEAESAEVGSRDGEGPGEPLAAEPVGLYQQVEQIAALRHEVKLLTKASRGSEERHEATLLAMQAAIEQFRSVEFGEGEAAQAAARPLVEGLADLDESLQRGRRVIENARRQWLEETSGELAAARDRFEALYRAQAWWRRALCRPWHAALKDIYAPRAADAQRGVFDALLEGYDLIQKRLARVLDQHEIIRMQCIGRQVDPNSMTVLETVRDPARPAGLVVEEVRLGYYWKTEILRFAEVKAIGKH